MKNDRRTEHSTTEEEVNFHYQSRRGNYTLWTSPLPPHYQSPLGTAKHTLLLWTTHIPTTYHHGGATNTPSSLDTPHQLQSPRGRHKYTRLDTPYHQIPTTNHHGRTTKNTLFFGHPISQYQSLPRHTPSLDTPHHHHTLHYNPAMLYPLPRAPQATPK